MKLDDRGGAVNVLRWSNKDPANNSDSLLAVGCQDNQVLVWNVNQEKLVCRLQAPDGE